MRTQNAILNINTPCSENWNAMSPTSSGRYCEKCAKQVIDFSRMTDQQILNFIQKKDGKLCGRLAVHQMGRELVSPTPASRSSRLIKMLLSGLFLTQVEMSLGQSQVVYRYEKHFNETDKIQPAKVDTTDRPLPYDSTRNSINGTIFDSTTHEPLIFANVYIKEPVAGTMTDLDGKFNLEIPESYQGDLIILVVSYTGYATAELTLLRHKLPANLSINLDQPFALGGVTVGSISIVTKRYWWKFWKRR